MDGKRSKADIKILLTSVYTRVKRIFHRYYQPQSLSQSWICL